MELNKRRMTVLLLLVRLGGELLNLFHNLRLLRQEGANDAVANDAVRKASAVRTVHRLFLLIHAVL